MYMLGDVWSCLGFSPTGMEDGLSFVGFFQHIGRKVSMQFPSAEEVGGLEVFLY